MHPMGLVLVDGYSRFLPYYKSLLDKLYVDYNVWTVGEYKSFVEPITRDDMSPQDEEASRVFLDGAVERLSGGRDGGARSWRRRRCSDMPTTSSRCCRKPAATRRKLAVDYGLVDELLTHDAMRERIRDAIGERPPASGSATTTPRSSLDDYVTCAARPKRRPRCSRARSPSSWRRARFSTARSRRARSAAIRRPS